MRAMVFLFILVNYVHLNILCEANDAPLRSTGRTVFPTTGVPVQMVSEKVEITIDYNRADVRCQFELLNWGNPDTIEVGFPFGPWETPLSGFHVRIAGVPDPEIKDRKSDSKDFPRWKAFNVPFDARGQKRTVYNSYSTSVNPTHPPYYLLGNLRFRYVLRTGAYWAGPIERAEVVIHLKNVNADQCMKILPDGYVRRGNHFSWEFLDFEPSQDIEIEFLPTILYKRLTSAKLTLQTNPEDADAHFELGSVYFHLDHFKSPRAKRSFLKAIARRPDNLNARWYLVDLYAYDDKTLPAAIAQMESIMAVDPQFQCTDDVYSSPWKTISAEDRLRSLRKRYQRVLEQGQ